MKKCIGIFLALTLFICPLLVSPLTVHAETTVLDASSVSYSYTTPVVYSDVGVRSETDGMWDGSYVDESAIYINEQSSPTTYSTTYDDVQMYAPGVTLSPEYYYKILITGGPTVTNTATKSAYARSSSKMYLQYAGEKYFFDDEYLSIIVPGNGYNRLGLGSVTELTVSSYPVYNNGLEENSDNVTYYVNSLSAKVSATLRVRIMQMTPDEVDAYSGDARIVAQLKTSNAYFEEMVAYLEEMCADNKVIMQKLDAIKASTDTVGEKIDALKEVLTTASAEDTEKVEEFQGSSEEQSNEIGQLTENSKTDKVDVDSTSDTIDQYVTDSASIKQYAAVLSRITDYTRVKDMILIALSVTIMGYVLFGKKR